MKMSEDSLNELAKVLDSLRKKHVTSPAEPNFFDVGGNGYLENPTSVLMALFMGMETPHVQPWLAKALVACFINRGLVDETFEMDWDNVQAECEVSIADNQGNSKFLDILVYDGTNVIGIENKVYAGSHYNPFCVYSELLRHRVGVGGTILKCILQASERKEGVERPWPILVYSELVDKAFERYGQDVLSSAQSKWQFYYQEFLHHLRELSGKHMTQQLDQKATDFTVQNFEMLEKSVSLLKAFDADLMNEATRVICEALSKHSDQEVTIKNSSTKWGDGQKILRFFPSAWGGHSQVTIGYFADSEEGVDGTIGFGVYVYISKEDTRVELQEVEKMFRLAMERETLPLPRTMAPFEDDEDAISYERSGKLLCLSVCPEPYTRAGTIEAARDFALWVQENVFDPPSAISET